MSKSIDQLRRDAKALRKSHAAGDAEVIARAAEVVGPRTALNHAEALHVVAREAGYESWPKLKFAFEAAALDREEKLERLKMALFHGQGWRIEQLLADTPDLARDNLGIMCALYDAEGVRAALDANPQAIHAEVHGPRTPILHLSFSRWWQHGGTEEAMLATASALKDAGADLNASFEEMPNYPVSALYGAIGHAMNLKLAEWFLANGADPNDGESLYHGCDLGAPALRLLLKHGARTERTNA
ncbi:MAG: ankyrin repeat domain-containing protein, partial [Boseongicola sp.]